MYKRILTVSGIILSGLLAIVGFVPWESSFPIELKGDTIRFWMGESAGSIGLIILLLLILIVIWNKSFRLKFFLLVPCVILLLCVCFFLFVSLLFPDFKWKDERVYKNGDNYLVQEQFDGFVTSNLTGPRLLMTKSPYSCIRKIEIKEREFSGFTLDTIKYDGKVWIKQPGDNEE